MVGVGGRRDDEEWKVGMIVGGMGFGIVKVGVECGVWGSVGGGGDRVIM